MPYPSLWEALGGLGLFFLGMKSMSEGLQKIAGDRIRRILERLVSNRITSAFIGSCLSASLQSGSAASILVIGFINAGLISLYQALAVMLGTGIGTTIAVQFIAFRVAIVAQPLIFIGTILKFFCRRRRWVYAGDLILGAGLVFLGLQIMESGLTPLAEEAIIAGLRENYFPWRLFSLFLGAMLSFMLQSGSAAVGVVIAITGSGLMSYEHGVHMVVGEVLGTAMIAVLATVNGSPVAKRAIIIYLLINLAVITLVLLFPNAFQYLVRLVTPGAVDTAKGAAAMPRLLANSHTVFNLMALVLFLPPLGFFVRSAGSILPEREKKSDFEARCRFIDRRIINTPYLAMLQARNELRRMEEIALSMFDDVVEQIFRFDTKVAARIRDKERALDLLQKDISAFLVELSRQPLSTEHAIRIPSLLTLVNSLEHVGDQNEAIINSLQRKKENKIVFSSTAMAELKNLSVRVAELVHLALETVEEPSDNALATAREMKDEVERIQEMMQANHVERLSSGSCTVPAGIAFSDIISAFAKISEYSFNIIKLGRNQWNA